MARDALPGGLLAWHPSITSAIEICNTAFVELSVPRTNRSKCLSVGHVGRVRDENATIAPSARAPGRRSAPSSGIGIAADAQRHLASRSNTTHPTSIESSPLMRFGFGLKRQKRRRGDDGSHWRRCLYRGSSFCGHLRFLVVNPRDTLESFP